MKLIVTLIFLTITTSAVAFDEWSREDVYRHTAFTALKLIDYSQTMKIARDPNHYYERNPVLGRHPSEAEVTGYFLGTYLLETALVHVLPSEYRPWAQYVFIGVSGAAVLNNFSVGLGFGF